MTRWNETHFQTEAGAYYKPRKSDRFDNAFQKELIMMKDGTVQNLLSSSVKGRKLSTVKMAVKGPKDELSKLRIYKIFYCSKPLLNKCAALPPT